MRRIETRLQLALALGPEQPLCVSAFAELEPNVAWALPTLSFRAACYAAHDHPLRALADAELREFAAKSPPTFSDLTQ